MNKILSVSVRRITEYKERNAMLERERKEANYAIQLADQKLKSKSDEGLSEQKDFESMS